MFIHKGYDGLELKSPVVTMGIFDGVHLGHRTLLDLVVKRAAEVNGDSVVITFNPHPRIVLEKNKSVLSFLSTIEEKITLLEKALIGHLIIIDFTLDFSRVGACEFIEEVLIKKIRTRHFIIGYDHHFGNRGQGDYNTLKSCSGEAGLKIEQVPGLFSGTNTISSSTIRDFLLKGRIEDASKLLGYNYCLKGKVIEGKKIGRKLGFPTANIYPEYKYKLIPASGVYAVEVHLDGRTFPGMLSIGSNPTVNNFTGTRSIEVNIFNFDREIYGREINIVFRHKMRDEIKFDDIEQLSRQMEIDRETALRLLD
jgi:riboflavin kinase/FMN adenylyltransferase